MQVIFLKVRPLIFLIFYVNLSKNTRQIDGREKENASNDQGSRQGGRCKFGNS